MITVEIFTAAVGRAPVNDDLDRCNCPQAGEMGHWFCGWDAEANVPMFMSSRLFRAGKPTDPNDHDAES